MSDPLRNPKDPSIYYENLANLIFTIVFLLELIFKVIATGLLFNGPKSYLRDRWQLLDSIIVICGVADQIGFGDTLAIFRVLRMLRMLKPLRVIGRNEGLKIAI